MRDLQIEGLPCKLVKPVRLLMKETDVSISTPKNAREKAPPKRGQVAWGMRAKGLSSTSTQFGARATVPVTVTRNSDCDFAATESVAYQLAASFHPLMSPHQYILGRHRYPSRAPRCYSVRDARKRDFAHLRRRPFRAGVSTLRAASVR